jgi:hypothetical protein
MSAFIDPNSDLAKIALFEGAPATWAEQACIWRKANGGTLDAALDKTETTEMRQRRSGDPALLAGATRPCGKPFALDGVDG